MLVNNERYNQVKGKKGENQNPQNKSTLLFLQMLEWGELFLTVSEKM